MNRVFKAEQCPVCDGGLWRPKNDGTHHFRHGRRRHSVGGMHYAICDKCGTRGYLPGQQAENRRLISDFQVRLPGYISPSEILSVREKYGLTQQQAARIFGGGVLAFSKWESGRVTPSEPTAKLILLALRDSRIFSSLAALSGEAVTADPPQIRKTIEGSQVELVQRPVEQEIIGAVDVVGATENIRVCYDSGRPSLERRNARTLQWPSLDPYRLRRRTDLDDISNSMENAVWQGDRENSRKTGQN